MEHGHIVHENRRDVPFRIDDYNDIFSDFDDRPYKQRALSIDFLDESSRAFESAYNAEAIHLRFTLDANKRNAKEEVVIRKRIKGHFHKHYALLLKEIHEDQRQGYLLILLGAVLISMSVFLVAQDSPNYFLLYLQVLLEPAGWFTIWSGFDMVFFSMRNRKKRLQFLFKGSQCSISFLSTPQKK